ncbi:MAG: phosphodiester glycosidase family protein [Actinomycetota bacterium]
MRTRLVVACLSAALVAGLLGAPIPARASFPGGAGKIAFSSLRTGEADLFSVGSQGGGDQNLTSGPGADLDPAFSADGSKIAFARTDGTGNSSIYVMSADGGGATRLTDDLSFDRQPAWSSDGSRIAFVRSKPNQGTTNIYSVRSTDGGGRRRLTDTGPGVWNGSPTWSPTLDRIAFVSNRGGGFPEIWVMNGDGSAAGALTTNPFIDANPDWAPDGTRIAFDRCCPVGSSDVWVMNVDGSGEQNLTLVGQEDYDPAWAPDGSRIAFVRHATGGGNPDIYSLDLATAEATPLVESPGADLSPSWQAVAGGGGSGSNREENPDALVRTDVQAAELAADAIGRRSAKAKGGARQRSRKVAPGVKYTTWRRPGPRRVFVLKVNPRKAATIDTALAGNQLGNLERTSSMAKRHGAVAAVNGDFAIAGPRPAHAFAEDGDLVQTPIQSGPNFAVAHNEQTAFINAPSQTISLRKSSGDVFSIEEWNNGDPVFSQLAAFSQEGGSLESPPGFVCAARLIASGGFRFVQGGAERPHRVDETSCSGSPLSTQGGVVVVAQAGSTEALLLRSLQPGNTVDVTWSLGFPGVLDSVGGFPLLVRSGQIVLGPCSGSICGRHPRTGVGITGGGQILLVVVDGRRSGWSIGMTLSEFAQEFRRQGAVEAMNLDGGGSSTMVVKGKVVNRPSDGGERSVSSAILVHPGGDQGEPGTQGNRSGWPEASGSLFRAYLDPASTGGFLDLLARRGARLPPELSWIVRFFRSA